VLDALWPGDAYADGFGIDTYDHWHLSVDNDTDWANHQHPTQGIGIGHVADWVRSHGNGKVVVIPEWGCSREAGAGNGDNPLFVEKMFGWFGANTDVLAAEAWFNEPYQNVINSIWNLFGDPLQAPNASAEYLARY
jgi:hypothetical protein